LFFIPQQVSREIVSRHINYLCIPECSNKTEQDKVVNQDESKPLHTPHFPEVEKWPHRPLFIGNALDVQQTAKDDDCSYPIGIPFDFETELFRGSALVRVRYLESSMNVVGDEKYFFGRKRMSQFIVQGRFLRPIPCSDVQFGAEFNLPLVQPPPSFLHKIIKRIVRRVSPGIEVELRGDKPKILVTLAESVQVLRRDVPGDEPDITSIDLQEHNELGLASKQRRQYFAQPDQAARHVFDTDHVYTFESFDDFMDYKYYKMNIVVMKYNLANTLNSQPLRHMAKSKKCGSYLYFFSMMHESLLPVTYP